MERTDAAMPRTERPGPLVGTNLAGILRGNPFFPKGLATKARLFTGLTITVGILTFLYSFLLTLRSGRYWWIALIFTTIVAGHFTVTLPLKKGMRNSVSITMGDVFVFLAILFFGTYVGVVVAVAEGATMNFRASVKHAYKRLFNLSQLSVAAFLVGQLFYWIHGVRPTLAERSSYILPSLLGSIAVSAAFYFLINTGLVATAMGLATGTNPLKMWRDNFIWTWIPQSAGTCLAAFTFLWIGDYAYSVLVVAPTVVLIYYAYRSNLERIKQAQQHLEETQKLLEEKTKVEEALRKAKQGLEDRVNHRTRELTKANLRLKKEIQERQIAEQALAAEKDRLSVTLSSLGEGVIATNREGKITLMNSAAEKLTGWNRREAIGCYLTDVFDLKDQKEGGLTAPQRFEATGRFLDISKEPVVLKSRLGSEYLISYSEAPNQNESGVVLVFRDVSDQKRMEEELLQAHKLESVGLLAGGIAHDFNNLLAGILLKSQLVRRALKKQGPVDHHLDSLEEATQRASMLTQQLLTFAKGGEPIKEAASIAHLLEESVEFCLRGSNFGCHREISADLWNVEMDKGQISQVIHNLVINAKQAMEAGGGALTVHAENVPASSVKEFPELNPGDYVKVEIRDTGTGIEPKHLSRIFEPYFTTKPKGHGLGLAGVYSILKRHGGHICVDSTLGEGTTFTFFLPASLEPVGTECPVPKDTINGSGRILVMDDDELLRECACEILLDLGYQVEAVRDGFEACSLYQEARRTGRPFDAVILDLTIRGGMGGKETIKRLREINPHVRAIVASGYSADPIMSDPQKYGFLAVLTKPFLVQAFATTLKQVLRK